MIYQGDALTIARTLPDGCLNCIVTSPPYFGLRDYGHPDQIGQEDSIEAYVQRLVMLFRELRRALHPEGTFWLNLGDSYSGNGQADPKRITSSGKYMPPQQRGKPVLPPKNLMMIPARVAIALQEDGWILRSEIVWEKTSPMPESVEDRPSRSHEMIYMFVRSKKYWYDPMAIRTPIVDSERILREAAKGMDYERSDKAKKTYGLHNGIVDKAMGARLHLLENGANLRDVWSIAFEPSLENHYAAFPTEIPRRCISLGCPPDGTVYDPFAGTGTTLVVAKALKRKWGGSELNPDYVEIIQRRLNDQAEYDRLVERWQRKVNTGEEKLVKVNARDGERIFQPGLFGSSLNEEEA